MRAFWTTRPEACGEYVMCGQSCNIPGLEYVEAPEGRTIQTEGWLQSLILNILNTRARTDLACPTPAATFGHWSESYRDDGMHIGSRLWNAAAKTYTRVGDAVKAIETAVKSDMAKLVIMKVADDVEVVATYHRYNRVDIEITASVRQNRHVINLSGSLLSGTWTWH